MDNSRSQRGAGRSSSRDHHISTIAHHFLPGAEEEPFLSRAPVLELVVASPDLTPASAFAAAGLLAHFNDRKTGASGGGPGTVLRFDADLFLHEVADPKWSAISYLDAAACEPWEGQVPACFFSPDFGHGDSWQVQDPGGTRSPRGSAEQRG